MMYQQWSDGQHDVAGRWIDFIEFAARHTHQNTEELRQALQKTYWFKWRREE
jgi:hypothetical protein